MEYERVPLYVEKVHKKTGIPIEDIERMSWPEIEKVLGIEIVEPPYEIKRNIKGFFAREFRWMTREEIEKTKREAERIVEEHLKCSYT